MEPYKEERIRLIKKLLPSFGSSFVLKGGTALMLFYNLDRYSEDVDLDTYGEMDITEHLINPGYGTWNIRVAKNTPTVFRVMVDYGAKSRLGDYPLRIEVSSRNKKLLNNGLLKVNNIDGINVYDVKELINMKISAFGQRDKVRDLYDLGFLLKSYPQYFDKDKLKLILSNMHYKGLENLSLQLKEEFTKYHLGDIGAEDFVLDMFIRCEATLIAKHKTEECFNKGEWDMER